MASRSEKGVLVKALKKADAILKEMVSMTLRSNLTRTQRISLETCITVHMHQKESTGAAVWDPWDVWGVGDMDRDAPFGRRGCIFARTPAKGICIWRPSLDGRFWAAFPVQKRKAQVI